MFTDYIDYLISSIQEKSYFVIKSTHNGKDWFFFDVENENPPYRISWTPRAKTAFKFSSYQAAGEFRSEFLSSRSTKITAIEE